VRRVARVVVLFRRAFLGVHDWALARRPCMFDVRCPTTLNVPLDRFNGRTFPLHSKKRKPTAKGTQCCDGNENDSHQLVVVVHVDLSNDTGQAREEKQEVTWGHGNTHRCRVKQRSTKVACVLSTW
jgi:hypothetical protein